MSRLISIDKVDGEYKINVNAQPEPSSMTAYCWRCEYRTGSHEPEISYTYLSFNIAPDTPTNDYFSLGYEGNFSEVRPFDMLTLIYGKTSDTEFTLMDRDIWTFIREPEGDFTLWQPKEEP